MVTPGLCTILYFILYFMKVLLRMILRIVVSYRLLCALEHQMT